MTWLYIYAAFMLGVVCGMFTLALCVHRRTDDEAAKSSWGRAVCYDDEFQNWWLGWIDDAGAIVPACKLVKARP